MKTKEFHFRLSGGELERLKKAGRGSKSLTAFVLSAANDRIRYRRVLDEMRHYDRTFKKSVVLKVFSTALREAAARLRQTAEGGGRRTEGVGQRAEGR